MSINYPLSFYEGRENQTKEKNNIKSKSDNRYPSQCEIQNYSEMLERLYISSLLGEIKCYIHRGKINILILLSETFSVP